MRCLSYTCHCGRSSSMSKNSLCALYSGSRRRAIEGACMLVSGDAISYTTQLPSKMEIRKCREKLLQTSVDGGDSSPRRQSGRSEGVQQKWKCNTAMNRQGRLLAGCIALLFNNPSGLALEGVQELSIASESYSNISGQWSSYWGTTHKFLDVAEEGRRLEDVLASCNKAVAIALLGDTKPQRRNAGNGEAFLQIVKEPQSNAQSPHSLPMEAQNHSSMLLGSQTDLDGILGLTVINKGILAVESVLGRPLYAHKLQFMSFPRGSSGCRKPYVVWEISSGMLFVDQAILNGIVNYEHQVKTGTHAIADTMAKQLSKFIVSKTDDSKGRSWTRLVQDVAPAVLLLALGSQVPLWFCIACPVVLGLLAPFVFNAGLGLAAEAICTHYSLSADECNDLWYGAFAAAMLLSFASAIPIVYICQIPKCGRGKA